MTSNKKTVWMCLIGLALGVGSTAWAQDPGSCCVQSTSRLDALLNPVKGGDEKFFTGGGGPPNVLLILDTSCSMHNWPQDWPATRGCAHPQIAGLGFDPSLTYEPMVKNVSGGTPSYNTDWFDVTKYYEAPLKGYGTDFTSSTLKNANTGANVLSHGSAAASCGSITGITGADSSACQACLATQGYYVYDASVRRVWGKFLNFYAPRDSGSVLVMSHLINDIRQVRFGIEVFGTSIGGNPCWGNDGRICLFQDMGPKCGDSFPLNPNANENNRSALETKLQAKLLYVDRFGNEMTTPLAGALYAAGHFFKPRNPAPGTDPFATWFGGSYPTNANFVEGKTPGNLTVCAACGLNAIVLITDGEPYQDDVMVLPAQITAQPITCVGGGPCSPELAQVAKWWWNNDMRPDYTGKQKVATYTVGFSQDANSSSTLKTAAQYGGGKFYGATNTVALRSAVFSILDEINSRNTSFSSAAIASVQSAGTTFAAILPRFSPQPNQPWIGSLRRFNLFSEFVEDYNLNPGEGTPPDTDKSDIWLVDNTMPNGPYPPATPLASARVVEDVDGNFVRWGTATPATPYWEAGAKLRSIGAGGRNIYTVRDSSGDGAFTSADAQVGFTMANSLVLGPYLGILGTSFCPAFVGSTVCGGGPNNGQACASVANCPSSSACTGGSNNGRVCSDSGDCPAGSVCSGGPNNGSACTVAADCPLVALVCSGGSQNGAACAVAADCPLGTCVSTPGTCGASSAGSCNPVATTCTASGAGTNGDMLTKWGMSVTSLATELSSISVSEGGPAIGVPGSQTALDDLCVKALISFIRGRDLADEDGNGNRTETRASVLGDIFHSSPAVVDAPINKTLCDKGFHNQCVRTLYDTDPGATPIDSPGGQTNCLGNPVTRDAYEVYRWNNRKRDKLILVGANDGMLHAFHDGNANAPACPVSGVEPVIVYDGNDGTSDPGKEVWAFIPPDLLPRLQDHVFGHTYFVDGDVMVRDVWADGSGATAADGRKTWDEYHTMAVIADGRGGTHYFALELRFTNTATTGVAAPNLGLTDIANNIAAPKFLWMYPQPCSNEASLFGKTLLSVSPKPPPIGPVLLDYDSIPAGSKPSASTPRTMCGISGTTSCNTAETWVVMLGGGWSPGMEKGRGIYMVDAWNGKVNGRTDNLIWKAEYKPSASGEQNDPLGNMRYSITAAVAMVDYGSNVAARPDGFFDTATVGDTGGQLWLARFYQPGKINSSTLLVDNWSVARSFEMDKDGDSGDNRDVKSVWPFFHMASVGIQTDNSAMRIFGGTGNRYALIEPSAGVCRFDNPLTCAKYVCDETSLEYKIQKNTLNVDKIRMHWDKTTFKNNDAEQGTSVASAGICGSPSSTVVTASISHKVKGCAQQSGGSIDYGDIRKIDVKCGKDSVGNFFCQRTDTNPENIGDLGFVPKTANVALLKSNRFFGIWGYGGLGAGARTFEEDKTSTGSWTTAKGFDGARLSDRTSGDTAQGDLIDVSTTTCTSATVCTGPQANSSGRGWFFEYSAPAPSLAQRTAGASGLSQACVLWDSIYPATASTSCGLAAVAKGRLHQADFITGTPNCAVGFVSGGVPVRYLDRDLQAPPAPKEPIYLISRTGQVDIGLAAPEPGASQVTSVSVSTGEDILRSIYEIPISRSMHKCRHTAGGSVNCVESPP